MHFSDVKGVGFVWLMLFRAVVLFTALIGLMAQAADTGSLHSDDSEAKIIRILKLTGDGRLDSAMLEAQRLTEQEPRFRLAKLLYADLAARKAGLSGMLSSHQQRSEVGRLLDEARQRWQHYRDHDSDLLPAYLLEMAPQQRHALVVDVEGSRLYLYRRENTHYRLLADYYVSVGINGSDKWRLGDKRTPLGVYFINDRLSQNDLPDRYGVGALPISYPNELDRNQGRTGYGIWLHGTPFDTFSRPPLDSDGCVILSNQDLEAVMRLLGDEQAPVIISQRIRWQGADALAQQRHHFQNLLSRWETDWESGNIDSFLQHYSTEFKAGNRDYKAWETNARVSYADAGAINIELTDLSVFAYPGEKIVVVTFAQDYQSNNLRSTSKKRQYWKQTADKQWKIIYEGPA